MRCILVPQKRLVAYLKIDGLPLLSMKKASIHPPDIKENRQGEIFIEKLSELEVKSIDETIKILRKGD